MKFDLFSAAHSSIKDVTSKFEKYSSTSFHLFRRVRDYEASSRIQHWLSKDWQTRSINRLQHRRFRRSFSSFHHRSIMPRENQTRHQRNRKFYTKWNPPTASRGYQNEPRTSFPILPITLGLGNRSLHTGSVSFRNSSLPPTGSGVSRVEIRAPRNAISRNE